MKLITMKKSEKFTLKGLQPILIYSEGSSPRFSRFSSYLVLHLPYRSRGEMQLLCLFQMFAVPYTLISFQTIGGIDVNAVEALILGFTPLALEPSKKHTSGLGCKGISRQD